MIPIPEKRIAQFEKLGFGIFVHWGLYSQLGTGEWSMNLRKIPKEEYRKLLDSFTAEEFDAEQLVRLAKRAGAKYITLTTRHHEGFSLYDTKGLSEYDSLHSPAGRDLVKEFVDACRRHDILPMLYHTTLDWYVDSFENNFDEYLDYLYQSVQILCTQYGKIGGLWFDGNWSKPDEDWHEDALYAMIRRHQPDAMIINNTGLQAQGAAGNSELDSVTFEQGQPFPLNREGTPKYLAAEMCQTMNNTWGVAKADFAYKSLGELIETLCGCRKVGANYLLNLSPTAQGGILKLQEALLEEIGKWIALCGGSIYEGKPSAITCEGKDFVLDVHNEGYWYVYQLGAAGHENVTVGGVSGPGKRVLQHVDKPVKRIWWVDNGESLEFEQSLTDATVTVNATAYPYGYSTVVRVAQIEFA